MKLIVIGTSSSAHLKCNSQFVSGYHAELLLLDNGEILLTDKGSKNGTYLNEQRLQPNKDVQVKRGDQIRFADYVLDWKDVPQVLPPDMTMIKEMRGIGTNFRNKHQLQGEKVSRFHATLKKKKDNKWYIQDHSKNGTTVNGQPIPANQDVKLKKGDNILCAGVPVPNPYGNAPSFNFRKVLSILSLILLLCGGSFGIMRMVRNASNNSAKNVSKPKKTALITRKGRKMSDEEIVEKYQSSTVFIMGYYYYKVSAGNLDLVKICGLPTEVVINEKGRLVPVEGKSKMHVFTATGFFVSPEGKVVTNLHAVRPWLFDEETSKIADQYKMFLANQARDYDLPSLNAYVDQVKVEGVMNFIGIIPNGAYLSESNVLRCHELVAHDNIEKDVAIIQLESKRLPTDKCTYVDLSKAVTDDDEIKVGSHVYTMGYPFGLTLQTQNSSQDLKIIANGGSVTQECGEYLFGFNAPSYHGASGSPIFNDKGQLIGVLSAGMAESQGFNYAVKASHAKELFDQSNK